MIRSIGVTRSCSSVARVTSRSASASWPGTSTRSATRSCAASRRASRASTSARHPVRGRRSRNLGRAMAPTLQLRACSFDDTLDIAAAARRAGRRGRRDPAGRGDGVRQDGVRPRVRAGARGGRADHVADVHAGAQLRDRAARPSTTPICTASNSWPRWPSWRSANWPSTTASCWSSGVMSSSRRSATTSSSSWRRSPATWRPAAITIGASGRTWAMRWSALHAAVEPWAG